MWSGIKLYPFLYLVIAIASGFGGVALIVSYFILGWWGDLKYWGVLLVGIVFIALCISSGLRTKEGWRSS